MLYINIGKELPIKNGALSDQRVEEHMIMQQSLVQKRPHSGAQDGWEWIGAPFPVQGAYKKLCKGQQEESQPVIRGCSFIWRQKVALKVQFFGWVLLRRRLLTRVFHKQLYLEDLAECTICSEGEEDCYKSFFRVPFARMIWNCQSTLSVDTTSEVSLWESTWRGGRRRKDSRTSGTLGNMAVQERYASPGEAASMDGVAYAVENLAAA